MTKMAAIYEFSLYGKTFKHFLLQNQLTDDLETWYIELDFRVQINSLV